MTNSEVRRGDMPLGRRDFLQASLVAGSAFAGAAATRARESLSMRGEAQVRDQEFGLSFAPHFGMFRNHAGPDPIAQLQFIAERGFRALEDNGMRERPVAEQERIAAEMARLGIRMGVFVAHTIGWSEPNLTTGRADAREAFLKEIRDSITVAQRVNATWMTVVPGYLDLRTNMGYQTVSVVEMLRRASELLEPHGLVMVLESLNRQDHPGLFLRNIAQAYEICRAVDSPACKILDDLYHQQKTEGNLIPNIDAAWSEIAYFQVGDNPGRNEPTTGEVNFANVFRHIRQKGFTGIVGMEHGNSKEGREGESAVIAAYRSVDPT
jgi:hydroxypyruvate isomerase